MRLSSRSSRRFLEFVLWSTEHGRSGALSGYDELNRIEKGGNYGWPVIEGSQTRAGMIAPVLRADPLLFR